MSIRTREVHLRSLKRCHHDIEHPMRAPNPRNSPVSSIAGPMDDPINASVIPTRIIKPQPMNPRIPKKRAHSFVRLSWSITALETAPPGCGGAKTPVAEGAA